MGSTGPCALVDYVNHIHHSSVTLGLLACAEIETCKIMADELGLIYSSANSSPWTWLQLPAISIGAEVDAVGESYYQDALEAVAGGRTPFGTRTRLLTVILAREPDNPYDANAVSVEAGGATLAHLSRDDAPHFHEL